MKTKSTLLLIAIILSTTISFGQKAKIKPKVFSYVYQIYPEIAGYEKAGLYSIEIIDKDNKSYSFSTSDMAMDVNKSIAYNMKKVRSDIKISKFENRFKLSEETELHFVIKQNSSKENEKEFLTFENKEPKVKKFSYKITANQNYTVKIFDTKRNHLFLKSFTFDIRSSTVWPGTPSLKVGYNSQDLLKNNFNKKKENEEGFYKKIDAALIKNAIERNITKKIQHILHEVKGKRSINTFYVKTKDTKFDRLDSLIIYINMGKEKIKENKKQGIKGNNNVENAKKYFLQANLVCTEYNKQEYINWFTNETLKKEYTFAMLSNLYITSFLISDFKTCNDLYSDLKSKLIVSANKFKRTPSEKALEVLDKFRPVQIREEKFEKTFKERYGY